MPYISLANVMGIVNFSLCISCYYIFCLRNFTSYIISYLPNSFKLRKIKHLSLNGCFKVIICNLENVCYEMFLGLKQNEAFFILWKVYPEIKKNFFSIYTRGKIAFVLYSLLFSPLVWILSIPILWPEQTLSYYFPSLAPEVYLKFDCH